MEKSTTFVGLDVHKESISVALAEGGERGEARVYGEIANRPDALERLVGKQIERHDVRNQGATPGRSPDRSRYTPTFMPNASFFEVPTI